MPSRSANATSLRRAGGAHACRCSCRRRHRGSAAGGAALVMLQQSQPCCGQLSLALALHCMHACPQHTRNVRPADTVVNLSVLTVAAARRHTARWSRRKTRFLAGCAAAIGIDPAAASCRGAAPQRCGSCCCWSWLARLSGARRCGPGALIAAPEAGRACAARGIAYRSWLPPPPCLPPLRTAGARPYSGSPGRLPAMQRGAVLSAPAVAAGQ